MVQRNKKTEALPHLIMVDVEGGGMAVPSGSRTPSRGDANKGLVGNNAKDEQAS